MHEWDLEILGSQASHSDDLSAERSARPSIPEAYIKCGYSGAEARTTRRASCANTVQSKPAMKKAIKNKPRLRIAYLS
jgi:hypothetical protein